MLFGYLPGSMERTSNVAAAASTTSDISVAASTTTPISQGNYTDDDGRVVTYALWLENDELQAEVSIVDPNSTDTLEMWLEGEDFRFEGVYQRAPFRGTEPASTFFDIQTDPDAPVCAGPLILVCIGAAAVILFGGGCSNLSGCVPVPETEVPGGGGGNPDPGDGGGGDGED